MEDAIGGVVGIVFVVFYIALIGIMIASQWKIFEKAGKPGWACLVPIYNMIVLMEIIGKPKIWVLYFFIPFVGIYFAIVSVIELAKVFGKDTGFAIGMLLLGIVFYPMLAFGDAQYQGTGGGKVYDDGILDRG